MGDAASSGNSGERQQPGHEPPQPEDVDEIFRKMKETGPIPNAVAMLDGLCKNGLVQEAMKLFGLMREKGSIPEVVIYTAVVEAFCEADKLDDAVRIFRKMQGNGVIPNAREELPAFQDRSFAIDEKSIREHLTRKGHSHRLFGM